MPREDLGPNVSHNPQDSVPGGGQYSADDHSYEIVVYEHNRPITDWELNLTQSVLSSRPINQKFCPSSFLNGDFLERPDLVGSYTFLTPDPPTGLTANTFKIAGSDILVNGWPIRFEYTDSATDGENIITVPAPPTGAGTIRTDFVFLEVWRALVSPAPDGTNKSPTGQILRNGNAKASDAFPPGNVNLADDIIDPGLTTETTRRVQIQYRYRVVSGINLQATPDGFEDLSLFANSTPYLNGSDVDGEVTTYNYVKSPVDSGLWIAGDGSPTSVGDLGTVDGFIYAIPICAVFRRNSAAFNRNTNMNGGGLMSSSTSGRPDGLYADQIIASDVKDLRKTTGHDWNEILEKSVQQCFNNRLSTQEEITPTGPGGTSILAVSNTGSSGHMGNPDGVRRFFSNRSVTEPVVVRVDIGSTPLSSFDVTLSSLVLAWDSSPTDLLSTAPSGTTIVGINAVRIVDLVAFTDIDALGNGSVHVKSVVYSVQIGPAMDRATFDLNTSVSDVAIYVEIMIEYPSDQGLERNVITSHQLWAPTPGLPAWIDQTGWTATSDTDRKRVPSTNTWLVDPAHRELAIQLTTIDQSSTFETFGTDTIMVWERLTGDPITIDDGVNPPYTTTDYSFNTAYTLIQLSGSISIPSGVPVVVTYKAFRALPSPGIAPLDSFNIFYQSRAIQSTPVPGGTVTLKLVPRAISKFMYIITSGSGSPDDGVPFKSPGAQIPVGASPAYNFTDAKLDSPGIISLSGISVTGGFIQLGALIPYSPDASEVSLYKSALNQTTDEDGRNFWPKSDDGLNDFYTPAASTQPFVNMQKHKVVLPTLMELKQDFLELGRKGTVFLVIFTRWVEFATENDIAMFPHNSSSCAAVFRVRGNIMNPKRSDGTATGPIP